MNNFRKPDVNPDSFQGKVYDYYRNPTKPNSIHFSIDNQEGSEHKEIQPRQNNNKFGKTKKQSIYTNHQLEKVNDSKPVMFSPPKVDSIQKLLNESSVDELSINSNQGKKSENEEMGKKVVISNLIKEFSLMLDDTPSINEEFTTHPESEFMNDSVINLKESTSVTEKKLSDELNIDTNYKNVADNHSHSKEENSKSLFHKFHSRLDGRNDPLINDENFESLNENTSILEDIFSNILSESDELQEEKQKDESQEEMRDVNEEYIATYNDTIEDNFLTLFSKMDELREEEQDSTTIESDIETVDENTDILADKFFVMLSETDDLTIEKLGINIFAEEIDGSNENTDTLADKFFVMLSETDDLTDEKLGSNIFAEEIDGSNENTDTLADKFITILSESDQLQKEKHNSSFANFKEAKSGETEDSTKHGLRLCHKKPSIEKKKRKYCLNKNNPYHIACSKEIDDEQLFQKNTYFSDSIENQKKITVKMPVLLTELETDIDIIETIDLVMSLDNILKVEWSVQSLVCKHVLPSKTVFLKGEFIAEIAFSNKGLGNVIQTLKVTIPWKKTETIHWLTLPDTPSSKQEEFMFQAHHEHDSNYHFEAKQKFAESIQSQLKQVHFVWHQELNPTDKQLQINGFAQLSIHFLQEQFVDLDCYSK